MKFPLREALRRDGKTHRPPAEVELDVERDAAEIDQLVGMGVIADVRPALALATATGSGDDQGSQDDGQQDQDQDQAGAPDADRQDEALAGGAPVEAPAKPARKAAAKTAGRK